MSFAKLDELCRKLNALSHALSMLGVDEAVMMPKGGGDARAEAMATLSALYHEEASAPHLADWIASAESEVLSPLQQAALREFKRSYQNRTCLTADFVRRQTELCLKSEQSWRELRAKGDWKAFLPHLAEVINLMREEASRRAEKLKLTAYDALMEQFDPGSRMAEIDPLFADLKSFLLDFIPKAVEKQRRRQKKKPLKNLKGPFAIANQKALGEEVMRALGFNFDHGRLDVSHHPFCGGVPTDVRMTTRYRTDEFLSALMGIMHETGHGLYEQNLPQEWQYWPSGQARGMAMHESQSLFMEKQIGRNPAFWQWAWPRLAKHFGKKPFVGWTRADLMQHVHKVEPGLIRVDADEVTYPMHIILRYELEKDLVSGALEAADIPEAWDAKMKAYLGLSTKHNMKDGPMQDVHWPAGSFGYFPSYSVGALLAAQQWAAITRQNPEINEQIKKGQMAAVNDWCRQHIWNKASTLAASDIIRQATGETLNARYFMEHLQARYG